MPPQDTKWHKVPLSGKDTKWHNAFFMPLCFFLENIDECRLKHRNLKFYTTKLNLVTMATTKNGIKANFDAYKEDSNKNTSF